MGRPPKFGASSGLFGKQEQMSTSDMLSEMVSRLKKQASEPNLYGYVPHAKQLYFHSSTRPGRLFIGGNRSGKSVAGVVEDLLWAVQRHPYRRLPIPDGTPTRGRVVSVSFVDGVQEILFPIFKRWVLPSDLINGSWEDSFDKVERKVMFANGSFIEFKSNDQALDKHAGTSRHFVHFDEEPPKAIYQENMMRLLDVNGEWWMTMTPVEGMTWVFDTIYEPKDEAGNSYKDENVEIVEVDMDDNPHLPEQAKEIILAKFSEEERKVRKAGKFVARGGLVYPEFQESTHAIMPAGWLPPRDWAIYTSVDHGVSNPTAWGWHAVSPSGDKVVTFHEEYAGGRTVKEWAQVVKNYEKSVGIKSVYVRTGDPAMRQRSGAASNKAGQPISILEAYYENGISLSVDGVPREVSVGVNRIRQYMRGNPRDSNRPFWSITMDCRVHITQLKRLAWETFASAKLDDANNKKETIKKKDDHTCDELRYFFTCLPDLTPEHFIVSKNPLQQAGQVNDWVQTMIEMQTTPDDAFAPRPMKTAWDVQIAPYDLSMIPETGDGGDWY